MFKAINAKCFMGQLGPGPKGPWAWAPRGQLGLGPKGHWARAPREPELAEPELEPEPARFGSKS